MDDAALGFLELVASSRATGVPGLPPEPYYPARSMADPGEDFGKKGDRGSAL